jgi:gluconate 2-dehydrogenase gamma chain
MQSGEKGARLSRRQFVAISAIGGAAAVAGCNTPGRGNWEFLTDGQAQTLTAICDRIIPADDFPSASQAGTVDYIDRQLARRFRRHRDTYCDGLKQAEEMSRQRFGKELAGLTAEQQDEIVNTIERQNRAFFDLVRSHTMQGFYGSPRHGGNRDAVSWQMVGLAEPPDRGRAQYDLTKGAAS